MARDLPIYLHHHFRSTEMVRSKQNTNNNSYNSFKNIVGVNNQFIKTASHDRSQNVTVLNLDCISVGELNEFVISNWYYFFVLD